MTKEQFYERMDLWVIEYSKFKWMAMDSNGFIRVYVSKPVLGENYWKNRNNTDESYYSCEEDLEARKHWKESLRKIER